MSIKSQAFGRVTLTGPDARKFKNQMTHGRPKAAAKESVKRGAELVRQVLKSGKATVSTKTR